MTEKLRNIKATWSDVFLKKKKTCNGTLEVDLVFWLSLDARMRFFGVGVIMR